eukprot:TRINITY_DN1798_c0_g1_i1.p1 TRINITY_DN1798_c0_g1~~TRINITY_DN1798_c0_g1_i1.p1  ORF type:complete len:1382 (+),score=233.54 TRINITY_DN1798_c0_g1_i1:131-4147(+)
MDHLLPVTTSGNDRVVLTKLRDQFSDRVAELKGVVLSHNNGLEFVLNPETQSKVKEDEIVAKLNKYEASRVRHAMHQLYSDGLTVWDPNFEEILAKHLAETYNYYQVRATRSIAQSQVDEVRRQRDEYFRQQSAQSFSSNPTSSQPLPPLPVKSTERLPSGMSSSGLQPGYGMDFPTQTAQYNSNPMNLSFHMLQQEHANPQTQHSHQHQQHQQYRQQHPQHQHQLQQQQHQQYQQYPQHQQYQYKQQHQQHPQHQQHQQQYQQPTKAYSSPVPGASSSGNLHYSASKAHQYPAGQAQNAYPSASQHRPQGTSIAGAIPSNPMAFPTDLSSSYSSPNQGYPGYQPHNHQAKNNYPSASTSSMPFFPSPPSSVPSPGPSSYPYSSASPSTNRNYPGNNSYGRQGNDNSGLGSYSVNIPRSPSSFGQPTNYVVNAANKPGFQNTRQTSPVTNSEYPNNLRSESKSENTYPNNLRSESKSENTYPNNLRSGSKSENAYPNNLRSESKSENAYPNNLRSDSTYPNNLRSDNTYPNNLRSETKSENTYPNNVRSDNTYPNNLRSEVKSEDTYPNNLRQTPSNSSEVPNYLSQPSDPTLQKSSSIPRVKNTPASHLSSSLPFTYTPPTSPQPPARPANGPSLSNSEEFTFVDDCQVAAAGAWIPDEAVSECPLCAEPFTLFFRRHHCRACGHVVCGLCSDYQLIIPGTAVLEPSRVCKLCYQDITGTKHVEESLAKQTAQISLFVAKNMKSIPLSAYESFMNAVTEQVVLSEARVSSLASATRWAEKDIPQMALSFKQQSLAHKSESEANEKNLDPDMMRTYLNTTDFQRVLGLLGLPQSQYGQWISNGFGVTPQSGIDFQNYLKVMATLILDREAGYTWSYSLMRYQSALMSPSGGLFSTANLCTALDVALSCLRVLGIKDHILNKKADFVKARLNLNAPVPISSSADYKRYADEIIFSFINSDSLQSGSKKVSLNQFQKSGWTLQPCHPNFNMALSIALAIQLSVQDRLTVGLLGSPPSPQQLKAWTSSTQIIRPPAVPYFNHLDGTSGQQQYTFTDYAPNLFKELRAHYGISEEEYLASLGIDQVVLNLLFTGNLYSYQQIGSHGKSGSIFYYTHDSKFLIKTISALEVQTFLDMLPEYFQHLTEEKSLLVPLIGFYKIVDNLSRTDMHVIIMTNAFDTKNKIDGLFDLKGSTVGRITEEKDKRPGVPLKDLDFKRQVTLNRIDKDQIWRVLLRDTNFLSRYNSMDYSLLFASHTREPRTINDFTPASPAPGLAMRRGFPSTDNSEIIYLGIIDYLVPFSLLKKVEQDLKGLVYDKGGISAAHPEEYAKRFLSFMNSIIVS